MFKRVDKNNDGIISLDELRTVLLNSSHSIKIYSIDFDMIHWEPKSNDNDSFSSF